MKNRILLRKEDSFIRVLRKDECNLFVIDCIKKDMPSWREKSLFDEYKECSEEELLKFLDISFDNISEKGKQVANERFSIITNILPFMHNKTLRAEIIDITAKEHGISKQTIRNYICDYLSFNTEKALAPKEKKEKELTKDEKNMRWALNKFFYTINGHTLENTYTLLLKNKYCDTEGNLLEKYPSFYQFRYFFRKTKEYQKLYITREGLTAYQRNKRPILGGSVREYFPCIGTAMLDSTVCDIYLINEEGKVIGRPNLTVAIDAFSGMCLGFSLTLEGGLYSLKNLLLNIITDKKEYCEQRGIFINEEEWDVKELLPYKFITDKGSEYTSDNFSQISELGISIVNLPAFRPDMKSCVEKFFDCIQETYKPYFKGKGVVEKDAGERGKRDYRKDASLTLSEFEKVIIHSIVFYNTKRILNDVPNICIEENLKPYAYCLWNNGKETCEELIKVNKKDLILTLLPRTIGRFRRNGLIVNNLRYANRNFLEQYLEGNEVTVSYNPEDVGKIWLLENGKYIEFSLIESNYKDLSLADVSHIKDKKKKLIESERTHLTKAKVTLANNLLTIREQSARQPIGATKGIRDNRKAEEKKLHKDFCKEVK